MLEADRSPSLVRLRFLSGVGLEPATHTVRTRSLSNYPTPRGSAPLAQLVERQSHNLKVASSILAGSNPLSFYAFSFSHFSLLCRLVLHCACCNDACECVRCSLFAAHGQECLLRLLVYMYMCIVGMALVWVCGKLCRWLVFELVSLRLL